MTHYFHSGSNEIAEYTGTALKARYIYGPGTDEILAQIDYSGSAGSEAATSRRFFYSDGLGSVIATLDETGAVTKKYRYSPFGIHADTNDHSDQPWGYTGQRYDADSGLYYYKARYYHPSLGRFLSVDPVGYDDQMNLYAYVANRPMMFRDPSGRWLTSATNTASDVWNLVQGSLGAVIDPSNFEFVIDSNDIVNVSLFGWEGATSGISFGGNLVANYVTLGDSFTFAGDVWGNYAVINTPEIGLSTPGPSLFGRLLLGQDNSVDDLFARGDSLSGSKAGFSGSVTWPVQEGVYQSPILEFGRGTGQGVSVTSGYGLPITQGNVYIYILRGLGLYE